MKAFGGRIAISDVGITSMRLMIIRAPNGTKKYGTKKYVWEIVRDNSSHTVVQRSSESFGTMEEAYAYGSPALNQLLRRAA